MTTASEDFTVVRLTPAGAVDSTFGTSGVASTNFCGAGSRIFTLSVDPSGNILAGGRNFLGSATHAVFAMARFGVNGSLDTTFGAATTPGQTMLDFFGVDNHLTSIQPVLDSGGNELAFLVGGYVYQSTGANNPLNSYLALAQYRTNGSIDSTFGTNGEVAIDFGSNDNKQSLPSGSTLLIQDDGRILIGGNTEFSAGPYLGYNFAVARLWP